MIRVFASDIDGCLAAPYRAFELDRLERLSTLSTIAGASGDHPEFPVVTICSGRSYPYVEAMSQVLGLVTPVLFESGAGMFDPVGARTTWHPDFTHSVREQIDETRRFIEDLLEGTDMSVDYAKHAQAAMVGTEPDELARVRDEIADWVSSRFPDLRTYHTSVSVDVIPADLNKRRGLEWLADTLGVEMEQVAFIGDTNGDIPALEAVGYSFAPSNATDEVKHVVDHVCSGRVIDGVLEAYGRCVERNRKEPRG